MKWGAFHCHVSLTNGMIDYIISPTMFKTKFKSLNTKKKTVVVELQWCFQKPSTILVKHLNAFGPLYSMVHFSSMRSLILIPPAAGGR